jgi:hypothetical protein
MLDLLGKRRLGHAQPGGRPAEVAFLGNGDEVLNPAQLHHCKIVATSQCIQSMIVSVGTKQVIVGWPSATA